MEPTNVTPENAERQAITLFYRAIEGKDLALLKQAVAPDWQYLPPLASQGNGLDAMASMLDDLRLALPDMRIELLDLLVDKNKVGVRARVTGTQTGPLMGIAPTSKHVSFSIHSFHELRDGKITKTWHLEDWLTVFRQLDKIPSLR
ncbi:MAG TPA: ester cyclase [Paraburkholderia sp.]|jgi:predicted ester cyclase